MKKQRGITLIALVITIIILLILAGIAISLTLGERGIINMAKEAGRNYQDAANNENTQMGELFNNIKEEIGMKNPTLVSQITANDYGKSINYSANGINEWKVFYNDGTNVYIITSDYLDTTLASVETNLTKAKMQRGSGKYIVYWDTNTIKNNDQAVETLMNTNNWSEFASGKGAESATGAPTYEMFANSWNANPKTTGTLPNLPVFEQNLETDSTKLYMPHSERIDGSPAYWLANPCPNETTLVFRIQYNEIIGRDHISNVSNCAIRPVVCLSHETRGIVSDRVSID